MDLARLLCATAVAALCLHAACAAPAEVIDLAEIKPGCPAPFSYDATARGCRITDRTRLADLKSEDQCAAPSLKLVDGQCTAVAGKEPAPDCGNRLADLVVKDGRCVVQRDTPRSATGSYIGDCFKIVAAPSPNTLGFAPGEKLVVLSQTEDGNDQLLRVTKADIARAGPVPVPYFCGTVGPELKTVRASDLNAIGAERLGWTYGVLALPFKYYRKERSFGSGVSLGPYVGRRSGAAGTAITFAVAATVGSVKGEVKDANGNITGTPDLLAYSWAAGWMYDISKSPGVKPFKIGFFVGQDRVSRDKVVDYKLNGQTWLAFQIGFDFTDN